MRMVVTVMMNIVGNVDNKSSQVAMVNYCVVIHVSDHSILIALTTVNCPRGNGIVHHAVNLNTLNVAIVIWIVVRRELCVQSAMD